jgi:hypothetical protein
MRKWLEALFTKTLTIKPKVPGGWPRYMNPWSGRTWTDPNEIVRSQRYKEVIRQLEAGVRRNLQDA